MSLQDRLCFLLAKQNDWTCVSDDGALRKFCAAEGVPLLWGLEMMGLAVEAGVLPGEVAEAVARTIEENNPYVTEKIVAAFVAKFVRKG